MQMRNGDGGPSTLSVSFTFNEAMDTDTDPTVTFDPAVHVHIDNSGAWLTTMARPSKLRRLLLIRVLMPTPVTIDIKGAKDAAGNLQVDHTATVGLEIDTINPDKSTISIVVADNDQTDGDAATSFTVSTTDADPGTIHVDMRGSEHAELTSIKSSYIADVNKAIADLETAESTITDLEAAVVTAQGNRDAFFGTDGAGKGFADSEAVGDWHIGRRGGACTGLIGLLAGR